MHNRYLIPLLIAKNLQHWLRQAVLVFVLASLLACLLLRWLPALTSGVMVYRHWQDLTSGQPFQAIDYRWVSSKQMSPHAGLAVIASEDQQFFHHHGFDFTAISASLAVYGNGGRLRGASTISQQVAKNLFLTPSRSFIRKVLEAWFTVLLELLWDKPRILEMYLNIAEFGNHIFGIEAASQYYFGISAKQLSRAQCALLAAALPNPITHKIAHPSPYLLKRQQWILRQMRNLGDVR